MDIHCNLCGSKNYQRGYLISGGLRYAKCNNCGLIFQCPMFSHKELIKIYKNFFNFRGQLRGKEDGYNNYEEERSQDVFRKYYLGWLNKYITDKGSFLDFGCATGNLVELMIDEGHKAEGCEFSEEAISALLKKKIPFWRCKDINKINKKYKYISMIDVIEHLEDPSEDLKKINLLLEDNGILFIETVNSDDFFAKHVYKGDWQGISPTHLYLWGRKTLARLLRKSGFRIIKIETGKMSGSLISRITLTLLCWLIRAALIFVNKKEVFSDYWVKKLKNFVEDYKYSRYQFSFGDGLRVVALKNRV